MSAPHTPAANALLRRLNAEAVHWAAIAVDPKPMNSFTRHGAAARRDELDRVVQLLKRELPMIEAQAAEGEGDAFAWLESGAGVPT